MDNQDNINYETVNQEVSDTVEETLSAKFCYHCGKELKAEDPFCTSCGADTMNFSHVRPISKKEKLKEFFICNKKNLLRSVVADLVVIAIVLSIFCGIISLVTKHKVEGIWTHEYDRGAKIVIYIDETSVSYFYYKDRWSTKPITKYCWFTNTWNAIGTQIVIEHGYKTLKYHFIGDRLTLEGVNFKRE